MLTLIAVLALIVASQLPATQVAAAANPARKVALGVSMYDGRDLSMLDAFKASIGGQRVAIWSIWRGWDPNNGSGRFPTAAVEGARSRGATSMIWWEPFWFNPADPRYMKNQNVIDGKYDDYIREFARDAKATGDTVLLRFAHQANSDYLPWGWDGGSNYGNTVDTFKSMWRHVHRIFDEVGASNVKWVWTVATQTCGGDGKDVAFTVTNCMSRPLGYPGDEWVDYVGFTWENWGAAPSGSVIPSGPWTSLVDGIKPVVNKLTGITSKPVIAAAIASAPDGGDRARWIRDGYKNVYDKLPAVVAIVWLNVDLSGAPPSHRDWSLRGKALDAYEDIAAQARFGGRIP
jgi:hypothetical protein